MRRFERIAVVVAAVVAAALVLSPGTASAAGPAAGQEQDARAVATTVTRGANVAVHSFFSGTVSPGGSQNWLWTNLPLNTAFKIGLSPAGASTSAACRFEVTNQWYERLSTGERRFHFTTKNIGTLACGTTIIISAHGASVIQSTGGMEPGEIKSFFRALTQLDLSDVPLLGVVPSGATSANSCRFKVVRTWFQRVANGDIQRPVNVRYDVQNTGSIACTADVEMGTAPVESRLNWRTLSPGSSTTITWNNANPTSATHLIGIEPQEIGCGMEITRGWYRQVVNSNGATERELQMVLRNVGTIQCTARPVLSRI